MTYCDEKRAYLEAWDETDEFLRENLEVNDEMISHIRRGKILSDEDTNELVEVSRCLICT